MVGALGNTLVILAIAMYRKLRNVHNAFIINLAVADLIINFCVDPVNIIGARNKGATFLRHNFLCVALATINMTSCIASMCSIASIAVERYLYICHYNWHPKIYNRCTVPFLVTAIWVYSFLIVLPNFKFIDWAGYRFDPAMLACLVDQTKANETGYSLFLFALAWIVPNIAVCYCYIAIYLFVRKSRFRSGRQHTGGRVRSVDKHVLKVALGVVIAFVSMWFPYSIAFTLSGYFPVPSWIIFVLGYIALLNSSVNFMIYAFSRDFRDGYRLVLRKMRKVICCQRSPRGPRRENKRRIQVQNVEIPLTAIKCTELTPV